jgi:hypothetical protein
MPADPIIEREHGAPHSHTVRTSFGLRRRPVPLRRLLFLFMGERGLDDLSLFVVFRVLLLS